PVRTVNQSARDVRPPMPTMKDVAARAGVAVSTVSRILNGTGYGSEQTRRRVLAASSALGYLPSLRARGLRQSRTMTIGVGVPVAPVAELDDSTRVRRHIEAVLPALLAAVRLLQHGGHERIAYVTRRTPMREMASLLGWVDARVHGLRKAGFEFDERYILRV